MSSINLLYKDKVEINDKISVVIPTVGEIIEQEDDYYSMLSTLTAMPIDMMVQLADWGIDFDSINEYDLFLITFGALKGSDTSLIFGDLDLNNFQLAINKTNETTVLLDTVNDIVIDRAIHNKIAATLRTIHHIEKNIRKPGNKEAREYMIERERTKMKRRKNKKTSSHLEALIVSLVNTSQYKYNFEETKNLTIYQFNECVRQVIKRTDYDNRMFGVYSGNVNVKDLSRDDLTWLKNDTIK